MADLKMTYFYFVSLAKARKIENVPPRTSCLYLGPLVKIAGTCIRTYDFLCISTLYRNMFKDILLEIQ